MKKIFIGILSLTCFFQSNFVSSNEVIHSVRIIDNYEEVISSKNQNIILIFSADWCKYCNKLKGDIGNLDFGGYDHHIIDVDLNPDLKKQYSVKSLPTSILIKNNKEVSRKSGYDKKEYQKWLNINREINNG
jgi:thioredoxin 1